MIPGGVGIVLTESQGRKEEDTRPTHSGWGVQSSRLGRVSQDSWVSRGVMEEMLGWNRVILEASLPVGRGEKSGLLFWKGAGGMRWWVTSCYSSKQEAKLCFSWILSVFPSPGATDPSAWSRRNCGVVTAW